MSEGQPWCKKAEAQSLAKRSRAAQQEAGVNLGDSFLIVTEGTVTEPTYFELLREDLQLGPVAIRIEPGDHSDPRHVIKTAGRMVSELAKRKKRGKLSNAETESFDHVWAVIDTDVAVRNGIWNDVTALAEGRRVKLAHSTPCFEFWLLLHLEYTTRADLVSGDDAKSALKYALGSEYSTNRDVADAAMTVLISNWPEAVVNGERVRQHHEEGGTLSPGNPSTEVCALVRALNYSAPRHLQKL